MGYIGASVDAGIGFSDGGLLTGMGADISKKIGTDMTNRLTENTNTSPDRIRYYGDPISMFDFNAKSVMPSFKQRWSNSAYTYSGLFIKDAIPVHDTPKNPLPLTLSGNDEDAEAITEQINNYFNINTLFFIFI